MIESTPSPTKKRAYSTGEDTPPSTPRTPKKRAKPRPYAPPEKYEHLHYLQDFLEPYQKVVFCGINPGYQSGQTGLYYAHSTNHFWQCLHQSGLTERLLAPAEAHLLPEVYNFGLTNLVDRPTAEQSELATHEMKEGVPLLMDKLVKYRPRTLCFLGRAIWDVFRQQAFKLKPATPSPPPTSSSQSKSRKRRDSPSIWNTPPSFRRGDVVSSKYFTSDGTAHITLSQSFSPPAPASPQPLSEKTSQRSPKPSFEWGLQPYKIVYPKTGNKSLPVTESLIFVIPSPSARVVAYQWWDKVRFFERLKYHISEVEDGRIDTCTFQPIPLTTTKSIYFVTAPECSSAQRESERSPEGSP
ncbi:uracil-DNA glycosylase-like protein [Irpex rosettiformis]|uniref:Uracil-DNA glycosylase-like protein n=1 Tax=Irpex rosettiformis TaxID=378272 RepID=A0ACB8UF55_9APHY|nr:uracil-DNA glycosylase-like protein [Irpex rosettiformis]